MGWATFLAIFSQTHLVTLHATSLGDLTYGLLDNLLSVAHMYARTVTSARGKPNRRRQYVEK
jgi:hypothetical protein